MEETQSKKEQFMKRFAEKYPDLDMESEDAYSDQANRLMDDYENYESATKNLIESLDGNEEFMEMLTQACSQEDFDPVVWMVENRGLDLEEAMKNPDYATVIAKAHSKYLEEEAEKQDLDKAMKANLPESIRKIDEKSKQLGMSDDEKNEMVGMMLQMGEDMVKGILSDELFETLVKGRNYDMSMEEAKAEGRREGLNIKIDEHLKSVRSTPLNIQPTQKSPEPRRQPLPKSKNPFIDSDWN